MTLEYAYAPLHPAMSAIPSHSFVTAAHGRRTNSAHASVSELAYSELCNKMLRSGNCTTPHTCVEAFRSWQRQSSTSGRSRAVGRPRDSEEASLGTAGRRFFETLGFQDGGLDRLYALDLRDLLLQHTLDTVRQRELRHRAAGTSADELTLTTPPSTSTSSTSPPSAWRAGRILSSTS